ncbi:type 1 fimbrial protein [Pseudomonas sp. 18.1.10]|uniref:fimbrial protein n=1 Tax=Pseudomonas sp. 18.1.10 TaxID=2969302 RepID=UPI00214FEACC|nr:fimbrial protein [Pseudomonas sp. 18.1.10]MCR4541070.1 type 1 fimbrial protein [Pseudomonas sp. 18.1.10]
MTLWKSLLASAAALLLAYSSGAAAEACGLMGSNAFTINFGKNLAQGITIPQDAPNGTILYQETSAVMRSFDFRCTDGKIGIYVNPALGSATSGSVYPLGVPGLAFRISFDNWYMTAPEIQYGNITFKYPSTSYTLEIVKSGDLLPQSPVPAVALAEFRADNIKLIGFNLINPVTVNAASCQTPSVFVAMGDDYQLFEFDNSGDAPRPIKFDLSLNNCQRGIQKVTYQLQANTPVIDAQKGIVALSGASTAKGIGLQLKNDAGQPIVLNTPYVFSGFNTTGTDFKIPLTAAYIRLADSTLQAGSANSEVTFIVNYL